MNIHSKFFWPLEMKMRLPCFPIPLLSTILLLCGLLLVLSLFSDGIARAEEPLGPKTVRAVGWSTVQNNDLSAAKASAVENGLLAAVENVALELLPPDVAVSRFSGVSRTLFGNAQSFIQSYSALTTEVVVGDTLRILVEAEVLPEKIKEKMIGAGLLEGPKTVEAPRLIFFIAEQRLEGEPVRFWWRGDGRPEPVLAETVMAQVLSKQGFAVANDKVKISNPDALTPLVGNPYPDAASAVAAARALGADIVVVGTAAARVGFDVAPENIKSFSSTVSARAYRTDTGQAIGEVTETETASAFEPEEGATSAIRAASISAAGVLAQVMGADPDTGLAPDGPIQLVVMGTGNLGNFVMFRKALSGMPAVKEIRIRRLQSNEATIEVEMERPEPEKLLNAIRAEIFESFEIRFHETGPNFDNQLRIELVPK